MNASSQQAATLSSAYSCAICLFIAATFSTYAVGQELQFAGRNWNIKRANTPVGPGGNRFSSLPTHVWSDQEGLHLTIRQSGSFWFSTEVILDESLGYGTYVIQTNSRQDIIDPYATFGAFTWDTAGDETKFPPGYRNREIDFEDSRWGNINDPTNTQFVVQPYFLNGNLERYALPDLSNDPSLTRVLKWSPGKVEFTAIKGHYLPDDFPPEALINEWTYEENPALNRLVPEPGAENWRFNLWLQTGRDAPFNNQTQEVIINDFLFIPPLLGDYDGDGAVGPGDFSAWESTFGEEVTRFTGADGNGDGIINAADYTIWRDAATASTTGVPEPCGCVLACAGAACAAQHRARRPNQKGALKK